jgi:hypothetical protein
MACKLASYRKARRSDNHKNVRRYGEFLSVKAKRKALKKKGK